MNQITTPNFLASYGQGLQINQAQQEIGKRNALTQAMQAGDMGAARNAYSALDPVGAYQAAQPAKRDPKQTMALAGQLTRAVLGAPPEMRGSVYAEALEMASGMGMDVSGLPQEYDEQSVTVMDRLFNMPDEQKALFERQLAAIPEGPERDKAVRIALGLEPSADAALRVGAQNAPKPATFRPVTPEEAKLYGGQGQIDTATGRFYPLKDGNGITAYGPDGNPLFTTGDPAKVKPFTEGQSKDVVYSTRARGALEAFEPYAGALTSFGENMAEYDPTGVVRGRVQSDEFQLAKNAGEEFLQAILRKDTGAAITSQEQDLYGKTYLPQPGDNALVLEQKARARQRAVAAIEAGMSPAQMIAQERGLRGAEPEARPRPYQNMSDDELKRALGLQ